jgi:hypothetical protein
MLLFSPLALEILDHWGKMKFYCVGSQFERTFNIDLEKEAVFQLVSLNNIAVLTSTIAEPTSQDDWELLVYNLILSF